MKTTQRLYNAVYDKSALGGIVTGDGTADENTVVWETDATDARPWYLRD